MFGSVTDEDLQAVNDSVTALQSSVSHNNDILSWHTTRIKGMEGTIKNYTQLIQQLVASVEESCHSMSAIINKDLQEVGKG